MSVPHCSICLNTETCETWAGHSYLEVTSLTGGVSSSTEGYHLFHTKCLGTWMKMAEKCPICRVSCHTYKYELTEKGISRGGIFYRKHVVRLPLLNCPELFRFFAFLSIGCGLYAVHLCSKSRARFFVLLQLIFFLISSIYS